MKSGKNNGKPETWNFHENQVFQQLHEWFLSYRLEMNIKYGSGEIIRNIITCITCTLLQLHVHVYSIFDKYMDKYMNFLFCLKKWICKQPEQCLTADCKFFMSLQGFSMCS